MLSLIAGILIFSSCIEEKNSSTGEEKKYNIQTQKIDNSSVQRDLLVGSWIDNSPAALHFTLFEDGTARSDNMQTLLYKKWKVNENQIIFTIESIGNKTSSVDEVTYAIEKLTKNELVLRKEEVLLQFIRKP